MIIQHQGADILSRVNLFLGAGAVGKLRIVQGPVKARLAASGPAQASRTRRKLKPLDAGAEAELEKSVSGAQNEGLRLALFNLGRAVTSANG